VTLQNSTSFPFLKDSPTYAYHNQHLWFIVTHTNEAVWPSLTNIHSGIIELNAEVNPFIYQLVSAYVSDQPQSNIHNLASITYTQENTRYCFSLSNFTQNELQFLMLHTFHLDCFVLIYQTRCMAHTIYDIIYGARTSH